MLRREFLLASALMSLPLAAPAAEPVDYLRDIKPILKERCFACHGALKQQSGLRLDTGASIRHGGDSGPAVVAGQVGSSPLFARISAVDPAMRMPSEGKPLTAEQIALIKSWIEQGASSPENEPPEPDPREHWAFKKPTRPAVPEARNSKSEIRNAVDAFVAEKLAAAGLEPRPEAEKHVLLRRVTLDLIGLPPTREELQAFLADDSPSAYETVVDRLLRDPRHGERWARHWMDIWRYSDWYGRRHVPDVWNSAPQIWRWRDWIVRSLNADHGYDRLLREMLAADEICPDDDDATVATGYLIRNWYALNPNDWMRSTVEHTGKAFLGLTFNCAHCHDHKYDPISQDDYFRLRAFFEPISIRQDRVPGEADPGPFQEYDYGKLRKIQRLGAVRIFDKTPDAPTWFYTGGDERNRVRDRGSLPPGVPAFLSETTPQIAPVPLPTRAWSPALRPTIIETTRSDSRAAIAAAEADLVAAAKLTEPRSTHLAAAAAKLLATRAELASLEARIGADQAKLGETSGADVPALARTASKLERDAALRRAEADVLAREDALAVAEAKPMTDMNRAKEVDAATKGLAAARPVLDKARAAANDTASETYTPLGPTYPKTSTGRRKVLAEWMTSRTNPLTARVAVNHIWSRHLHQPLVASVTDFGRNGANPTHPELLDWLASEFLDSGWSMKHLHRLIVTSETYRRASGVGREGGGPEHPPAPNSPLALDPENKLLWRMNAGRMEAEVVRDSVLSVAGKLDSRIGGQELENSEALTTFRRSLYYSVFPEQGGKSPLGELFDAPDALDCYRRTRSVVPQQALALTNSELIHRVSAAVADSATETNAEAFIVAIFERLLSRSPAAAEVSACLQFLADSADARRRESLVRALLNHNDFVTIR
jgi:mono/diheme cytochrome c family protein